MRKTLVRLGTIFSISSALVFSSAAHAFHFEITDADSVVTISGKIQIQFTIGEYQDTGNPVHEATVCWKQGTSTYPSPCNENMVSRTFWGPVGASVSHTINNYDCSQDYVIEVRQPYIENYSGSSGSQYAQVPANSQC